ncbi:hypothetical protein BHAMNSH16_09895 [Brachyspira hampsonii]|uniref:Uncharacterized protein n=1 Tax=Brachyspira hampsonii TaxID=1287055 RepID=A0AAC9TXU6_9SPIR|nr:hypothetical protein BHAMNSH16_09895 [Brachyspira hampsonii]MBW5380341.1 DUF3149 domain-containing protein [Brachyspira hampsonii]MBW5409439.1 DUF3149 domain-containing protein [Brachyspira hampsonii]
MLIFSISVIFISLIILSYFICYYIYKTKQKEMQI